MTTRKSAPIKVVNIRSSRGMEDDCFSFDVKQGRKLLAKVTYLGCGGPTELEFTSPEVEDQLIEAFFPEMQPYMLELEQREMAIHESQCRPDLQTDCARRVEAIKNAKTGAEIASTCGFVSYLEFWAGKVMDDHQEAKQIKTLKNQCTLRLWAVHQEMEPGTYCQWKLVPTEENIAKLTAIQKSKGRVLKVLRPEHYDRWGVEAPTHLRAQCVEEAKS